MKKTVKLTKEIKVPVDVAFRVVKEVEHYPEFLPHVAAVQIISKDSNRIVADMELGYKPLTFHLMAEAILNPTQSILIKQIKGPLKSYEQLWRFEVASENTRVTVTNTIEFSGLISGLVILREIKKAIPEILEAFIKRAEQKRME